MSTNRKFTLVMNCMDGRCQLDAFKHAQAVSDAEFADTLTEPGMDGLLAGAPNAFYSPEEAEMVRGFLRGKAEKISRDGHGSMQCLIVGHNGCAGNPVPHETHLEHLALAKREVESWGVFERVETAVFDEDWAIKAC